jgi:hypothetical protein
MSAKRTRLSAANSREKERKLEVSQQREKELVSQIQDLLRRRIRKHPSTSAEMAKKNFSNVRRDIEASEGQIRLDQERNALHQELSGLLSSNTSAREARSRNRKQTQAQRKQRERHQQRVEQLQAKLDELDRKQKSMAGKHKLRQQRDAWRRRCSRLKDDLERLCAANDGLAELVDKLEDGHEEQPDEQDEEWLCEADRNLECIHASAFIIFHLP